MSGMQLTKTLRQGGQAKAQTRVACHAKRSVEMVVIYELLQLSNATNCNINYELASNNK